MTKTFCDRRLIENRRRKMERLRKSFIKYQALGNYRVDQTELHLGRR